MNTLSHAVFAKSSAPLADSHAGIHVSARSRIGEVVRIARRDLLADVPLVECEPTAFTSSESAVACASPPPATSTGRLSSRLAPPVLFPAQRLRESPPE